MNLSSEEAQSIESFLAVLRAACRAIGLERAEFYFNGDKLFVRSEGQSVVLRPIILRHYYPNRNELRQAILRELQELAVKVRVAKFPVPAELIDRSPAVRSGRERLVC